MSSQQRDLMKSEILENATFEGGDAQDPNCGIMKYAQKGEHDGSVCGSGDSIFALMSTISNSLQ